MGFFCIDNIVIKSLGKEQQADIDIKFEEYEDKEFAIVEVSASNKPVFLKANGKQQFFVRHAASLGPMTSVRLMNTSTNTGIRHDLI